MSNELKDCPFCGSANIAIGYEGQPAQSFHMRCVDCGACGPTVRGATALGGMPSGLGEEWNRRPITSSAPADELLPLEFPSHARLYYTGIGKSYRRAATTPGKGEPLVLVIEAKRIAEAHARSAVLAERSACAKLCDDIGSNATTGEQVADAIRARN